MRRTPRNNLILVASSSLAFAGCKAGGGTVFEDWFGGVSVKESTPTNEDDVNGLWRKRYGYNNPSSDRIKEGR